MNKETRDVAIEKGNRFLTKDPRDGGRIVEVREVLDEGRRFSVENEVHPRNPSAVGRRTIVSRHTLDTRFERISR